MNYSTLLNTHVGPTKLDFALMAIISKRICCSKISNDVKQGGGGGRGQKTFCVKKQIVIVLKLAVI